MNIYKHKGEMVCKWCMVPEHVAEELDKTDCIYCVHEGGHEWVDLD